MTKEEIVLQCDPSLHSTYTGQADDAHSFHLVSREHESLRLVEPVLWEGLTVEQQ